MFLLVRNLKMLLLFNSQRSLQNRRGRSLNSR